MKVYKPKFRLASRFVDAKHFVCILQTAVEKYLTKHVYFFLGHPVDICHICLYQNINNLECVQHFISLYIIYLRSKYEQFEPIKTGKNLRTAETESKLIISMMLLSEFSRTKNLVEIYRNKYLTKRKKKHQGFVYKKGFTIVSYKLHILRVFMLL